MQIAMIQALCELAEKNSCLLYTSLDIVRYQPELTFIKEE